MRKARFIFTSLILVNFSVSAVSPAFSADSLNSIVLNNDILDTITAGAVSSSTTTNALATGLTYAETETSVLTYAKVRQGNWQTGGEGDSAAQGNGLAYTEGSSISIADTTGVFIGGEAIVISEDAKAYTSVMTKAIDTRYAEIAIGHVRAVACCGSESDTNVQAATFTDADFSISQININEVNTAHFSQSVGNAVIVSISHP